MTNAETNNAPEMAADDPRIGFAMTVQALHPLIAGSLDKLTNPTPCPDFTVKELLEHLTLVVERCAAVGRGEHFSTTEQVAVASGWAEDFQAGAHKCMEAWTDSAKLEQMFEVPFGNLPGAPVLLTYTAELCVHGWDLATATDQEFTVPDEHLMGALFAAKQLPAEGRDTPEIPFGAVVDPGPDATIVEQMAGWMGRPVA